MMTMNEGNIGDYGKGFDADSTPFLALQSHRRSFTSFNKILHEELE